ncbi:PEPxxWA-CTERM sorting domain-containing protein [Sphingomonas endophytica]|uniref:PEP-CTERM protein-sorting domain-containing protein n=1 Tax=Sphingomonas endophytica TaxID=869719 RepID=A0A147HWX8_9SPHN|nr:PEPxxWA-CTERM sorting domain-containing protein [Sphingomonas endophytica]KTT69406.1 hypothetical protein NS334_14715 [Sphingomonas endophytica]
MIRFAQIAIAATALMAAMPAQAADFLIDTTKGASSGNVNGNTITYSVTSTDGKSTLNVKATGWSRGFDGNYTAGKVEAFDPWGLGVYQAGQNEQNRTNFHQIDNADGWEFVVLQFDQSVSLQSAVLTPFQLAGRNYIDDDAFIARGNASFASAMSNLTLRNLEASLNYDPSKQSGDAWFNSNSNNDVSVKPYGATNQISNRQNYNLSPDKSGNVWIIGGSFNGPDGFNDAFKLNQVKVSSGVPEPMTWMTMILGFGVVGAALRRRRGAVKAQLA